MMTKDELKEKIEEITTLLNSNIMTDEKMLEVSSKMDWLKYEWFRVSKDPVIQEIH